VQSWNVNPISTARLCAEVWNQIKNKDWSLVNGGRGANNWDFTKFYQRIGGSGGVVGYGAPASVGAALANKKHGRLSVSIQNDGDLMYAPGVLWTAAHHRIPLLSIMNNNRNIDNWKIGTKLDDPAIDYAKIAEGMGWQAQEPISDPAEIASDIRHGISAVESGQPPRSTPSCNPASLRTLARIA
jgi:acetolactate synthase-1/2/3 large subunit